RDMADESEPRPGRGGTEDRIDDSVLRLERERDPGDHHAGPVALGDVAEDIDRGVVFVVVRQELIAGIEMERADDGIDRTGRIGDEREIVRVGPDERSELATRLAKEAVEIPREELDRLPFHPVPVVPLRLENGARAGSERAVIQEGDRGIEG